LPALKKRKGWHQLVKMIDHGIGAKLCDWGH
jgi:hypothetical protein